VEARGWERAELRRGERGQAGVQAVERNGFLDPGQREVRRERAGLERHAQAVQYAISLARQLGQAGGRMNAGPENAGRGRVGEEAQTADFDRNGFDWRQGGQRLDQFGEPRLGPFADKLGRNVQITGGAPVQAGAGLEAGDELVEPADDFRRQIDGGEQAHDRSYNCRTEVIAGAMAEWADRIPLRRLVG